MKCAQVEELIQRGASEVESAELSGIELHAEGCASCQRAYSSWAISQELIKARAVDEVQPPPFFNRRVMALIRERKAAPQAASLADFWRASKMVFGSIIAVILILVSLTIVTSVRTGSTEPTDSASTELAVGNNSAEQVVMGDTSTAANDNLSNTQVMDTLFGSGE
jgi:hypothetical protein